VIELESEQAAIISTPYARQGLRSRFFGAGDGVIAASQ
jgi:hypothetical protein